MPGPAGGGAGPERAHRLGLHQHRRPTCRTSTSSASSPTTRRSTRRPRAGRRSRRFAETIKVKGQPDVPITVRAHAPRPGDLRRRRSADGLTGPARPAGLRAGAALDGARRRPRHAGGQPGHAAGAARWPSSSTPRAATSRRCRTWWWPTATATSAWSRPAACRCASPSNDLKGLVPAPGWDARYDWAGCARPTETPRETDPARGWIATANQRIHRGRLPALHHQRMGAAVPAAAHRAAAAARAASTRSTTCAAMQADVHVAGHACGCCRCCARRASAHPLAAAAQRELAGFDGTHGRPTGRAADLLGLGAPARAGRVRRRARRRAVGAQLATRSFRDALEGVLERDDAWWCDDKTHAGGRDLRAADRRRA